jgi:hypothetical protein
MSIASADSESAPPTRRIDTAKLLRTLAGAAARGVANTVAMGLAGVVLNLVLLAVCWRALGKLGPAPGTALHWKPLFAGALLVPGFPVAWVLVGKKRGLDAAVRHVAKTYKTGLVEVLFRKLAERMRTPEWVERFNRSGVVATLNEWLPVYLEKLDDFPRTVRPLVRAIVKKVDVGGFLLATFEQRQVVELDPEQFGEMAAERANAFIDDTLLTVSWTLTWIVLGTNLAYAVGLLVLTR